MNSKIELRTGQIFECVRSCRDSAAKKGKFYVYVDGELREFNRRYVNVYLHGAEMLNVPSAFERAEGCPFCGNQVYDAATDQEIQSSDGRAHDGYECAADWDARVKKYCRVCNGDTENGHCPRCTKAHAQIVNLKS
jgi:hypothetical protein